MPPTRHPRPPAAARPATPAPSAWLALPALAAALLLPGTARAEVSVADALAGAPPACSAAAPIVRGWSLPPGVMLPTRTAGPSKPTPRRRAPVETPDDPAEATAAPRTALHECTLTTTPGRASRT